jgi:predicted amidophosphoribosyltransferase
MQAYLKTDLVCAACGAPLDEDADHCDRCGRIVRGTARPIAAADPALSGARRLIDRPWFVLMLLFCATAALGLPLLWKSRGFSRFAKLLVSLLVTVYTVLLLWAFGLLMHWCWLRIVSALA